MPLDYSNKREDSKYDVKAGTILELNQSRHKFNSKITTTVDHKVYLWIQSLGVLREGRRPQQRTARVLFLFVPLNTEYKSRYMMWEERIQIISLIRRYLGGGYKVLATDIPYYRKMHHYEKPYRIMGIIQ